MSFLRENRLAIILTLVTLGVFFQKLSVPFLWDDFPFILQNESVQSLSHTDVFFYEDISLLYRPLRQILFAVCYSLFGEEAIGYHVVGLMLHIGVVLSLFAIMNRIFENRLLNFFAVLLFAIHPVHAERVLMITASFDVLGDLLALVSLYFYLLFTREEATSKRTWSLLFFFLALLSSENAAILIPLICVHELIYGTKPFRKKEFLLTLVYYGAVFFGYFWVRTLVIHTVARTNEIESYFSVLFSMPQVFLQYLHILFFPVNMSVYRAPLLPDSDYFLTNIVSCGIVLLLLTLAFSWRIPKELRFALLWFFACLIPVSNIIPTGNIMEERYLYLPSFGFSLFLIYLCTRFPQREKIAYGFLVLISLIFATLLIHKSSFYLDERTKWLKDVQTMLYLYPEDYENSLKNEAKSLDLNAPLNERSRVRSVAQSSIFYNAGNMENDARGCESAEELYRIALVLNPGNISAWHNLYGCLSNEGRGGTVLKGMEVLAYEERSSPEVKIDLLIMLTGHLINKGDPKWRTHIPAFHSLPLSKERTFEVFRNVGIGALKENHFGESLFFFKTALKIHGDAEIEKKVAELERVLGN